MLLANTYQLGIKNIVPSHYSQHVSYPYEYPTWLLTGEEYSK